MRAVGFGRNKAIQQSKGKYLCFFDAVSISSLHVHYHDYRVIMKSNFILKDDIMAPQRIELQYAVAIPSPDNMVCLYSVF